MSYLQYPFCARHYTCFSQCLADPAGQCQHALHGSTPRAVASCYSCRCTPVYHFHCCPLPPCRTFAVFHNEHILYTLASSIRSSSSPCVASSSAWAASYASAVSRTTCCTQTCRQLRSWGTIEELGKTWKIPVVRREKYVVLPFVPAGGCKSLLLKNTIKPAIKEWNNRPTGELGRERFVVDYPGMWPLTFNKEIDPMMLLDVTIHLTGSLQLPEIPPHLFPHLFLSTADPPTS